MNQPRTLISRLDTYLWDRDWRRAPPWRRLAVPALRLLHALLRDFTSGQLNLRAMSLVYTTLLSLVPLLAVSFSILKGFGVHNRVQPLLLETMVPLGETGEVIVARIIEFVENVQVGVLGTLGLLLLIYTSLTLIRKIEEAFNDIWRVTQPRSLGENFTQHLSFILIGPVLIFTALGLANSIQTSPAFEHLLAIAPLSEVIALAGGLLPSLTLALAFAFVYVFLPNTKVLFRHALAGALVAAALWQLTGWGFTFFMASSTRYTVIYSGLAIAILFMVWVYVAWLILLAGASIAFYLQNPEYLAMRTREPQPSGRFRERLALVVAGQVARRYYQGGTPWDSQSLARALAWPADGLRGTLDMLEAGGYVIRLAGEPPRHVPAQAPETLPLKPLLDLARGYEETLQSAPPLPSYPGTAPIETRLTEAMDQALSGLTLKDLADQIGEPRPLLS
jgi:membrane protein